MIHTNWRYLGQKTKSQMVDSDKDIRVRVFLIKDSSLENPEEVFSEWVEHDNSVKTSWLLDLMQESGVVWFVKETKKKITVYLYSNHPMGTIAKWKDKKD